jgi:hypothetical protein
VETLVAVSWVLEWILEGLLQCTGEEIHRKYGWLGCLTVLAVIALIVGAIIWVALASAV